MKEKFQNPQTVIRWLFAGFTVICLLAAVLVSDCGGMLDGLVRICTQSGQTVKSYFDPSYGGFSGTFLNVALVCAVCLGLYCLPGISTRYRDREASVQAVSDALAALARAKVGNYLAFFPSYAYLRQVHEDFTARYPDIGTLAQESGLDDAARAAFLEQFSPSPTKTLLGFGVMGGIFGEGVDLVGDRLIGCAIVGVGLPQVNPRQEILRRYYDEAGGTGFDYAYRFPGMNKVLQAAGRVIRTSEDKGVVLLLDDRFARAEYTRLFPRHWHQLQYLRSTTELEQQLATFWALNQ